MKGLLDFYDDLTGPLNSPAGQTLLSSLPAHIAQAIIGCRHGIVDGYRIREQACGGTPPRSTFTLHTTGKLGAMNQMDANIPLGTDPLVVERVRQLCEMIKWKRREDCRDAVRRRKTPMEKCLMKAGIMVMREQGRL